MHIKIRRLGVIIMPVTRINFRTDQKTKKEAEELFEELGLDMPTALNMFLKQAVREQALPIRPSLQKPLNAETQKAINHVEKTLRGEISDDGASFDNAQDAATFLD